MKRYYPMNLNCEWCLSKALLHSKVSSTVTLIPVVQCKYTAVRLSPDSSELVRR
jgi:hypothetical protein